MSARQSIYVDERHINGYEKATELALSRQADQILDH